jgi:hypothetical protein
MSLAKATGAGVALKQMWTLLDFFNFMFLVVLVYGALKAGSR